MKPDQKDATGRRGRIFRYAPFFLWLGVIFYMSSSQGAMSNTSRFVRPFLEWLLPNASEDLITVYHGHIRKSAHVFEYAVLAFWSARLFRTSARATIADYWQFFAFLTVLLTASLDELNQSYNSSRTGTANDVLLDCAGGLAMILILTVSHSVLRKRRR
jgi:VanZ family protein